MATDVKKVLKKGSVYTLFIIWGYSERVGMELTEITEYQMIDTDYKSALTRAKLLYGKKNYLLKTVIENFKP